MAGPWYHISNRYLGKRKLFYPRLPTDGRKIPSICVCPTIEQCLVAVPPHYIKEARKIYVYRADTSIRPTKENCKHLFDIDLTHEHRFHKRIWFNLDMKIDDLYLIKDAVIMSDKLSDLFPTPREGARFKKKVTVKLLHNIMLNELYNQPMLLEDLPHNDNLYMRAWKHIYNIKF